MYSHGVLGGLVLFYQACEDGKMLFSASTTSIKSILLVRAREEMLGKR